MVLAIRTDAPEAELKLFDAGGEVIGQEKWLAERRLAKELLGHLESFLTQHETSWGDLSGLVVFQGPGSFTGLRIGITVMNTVAYAQDIPIAGTTGDDWAEQGVKLLQADQGSKIVLPEYGADAHITKPRK